MFDVNMEMTGAEGQIMEVQQVDPKIMYWTRQLLDLPFSFDHSNAQTLEKDVVSKLFSKRYEFKGRYSLPEVETLFTGSIWHVQELQKLKKYLNEVKSKLNNYSSQVWRNHTRNRNKSKDVYWSLKKKVNPEFLTQAWCKLFENVSTFPLVSEKSLAEGKLNSVHLCEAPGAFITSLNHWLKLRAPFIEWNWLATTLNPHYEGNSVLGMIDVDNFIMETAENWFFGADQTGNLMDLKNLDALVDKAQPNVGLVTADGSISCVDTPAEQENVVSHLQYCEAVAALHLLAEGGNLLLKIFTIFENATLCLVYLLACCFDRLIVNKPATSKEGNSEVYLVCLGFAGASVVVPYLAKLRSNYESASEYSMFRRNDVPLDFVKQVIDCGDLFTARQCEVILANIEAFSAGQNRNSKQEKKIQRMVADHFMRIYRVEPLPSDDFHIVGNAKIEQLRSIDFRYNVPSDSYNSRRERALMDPKARLWIIYENLECVEFPAAVCTVKFDNDEPDLSTSTGKPYEKLENSKFCAQEILQMYFKAREIASEIEYSGQMPSPEAVQDIVKKCSCDNIAKFEYERIIDSHNFITRVSSAFANTKKNGDLILFGYSLLSQLQLGLLYLLAHSFDSLNIIASLDDGSVINLQGNRKSEKTAKVFERLVKISNEANEKGAAVLSVVPIATLCNHDMFQDIVKNNHWIIKCYVRHMVTALAN